MLRTDLIESGLELAIGASLIVAFERYIELDLFCRI